MRQRGSPRSTTCLALLFGVAGFLSPVPWADAANLSVDANAAASLDRTDHVALEWPEAQPLSAGQVGPATEDSSAPRGTGQLGRRDDGFRIAISTRGASNVDSSGFGARLLGLAAAPATGPPVR